MVSVPGRVSTSLENDWPANPPPVAWRMRDIISIPRQIDRQVLGGKAQDFLPRMGTILKRTRYDSRLPAAAQTRVREIPRSKVQISHRAILFVTSD